MDLKGKKVLVTGGAGFFGSFVVEKLKRKDVKEIFVPRSRDYDLRKQNDVERLFKDTGKVDIVIHMAGVVGGITFNRKNPAKLIYDNLSMAVNMVHHSYLNGVDKFVGIGSVCGYPKFTPLPFKEEDFWNGYPEETNAPYGLAKRMLLAMSQAYHQQYGFNAVHLICINLYGPRDDFNLETSHVIPALIRKFHEAKIHGKNKVVLFGDGSPTREFLYVEDAADGVILAVEKYDSPEPVNLGSGMEISIKELAEKIKNITGFEGEIVWDTTKPNGQPRRCLDVSKAEKYFGFKAKTPFDEGLKKTYRWFVENYDKIIEKEKGTAK